MNIVYDGVMKVLEAQLRPYLEIGRGPAPAYIDDESGLQRTRYKNVDYSDVKMADGLISINNGQLKHDVVNERLSDHLGLSAFEVRHAQWKEVRVKIPWTSFATQSVEIQVEGLQVVLTPTVRSSWSVEEVRRHKEVRALACAQGCPRSHVAVRVLSVGERTSR